MSVRWVTPDLVREGDHILSVRSMPMGIRQSFIVREVLFRPLSGTWIIYGALTNNVAEKDFIELADADAEVAVER